MLEGKERRKWLKVSCEYSPLVNQQAAKAIACYKVVAKLKSFINLLLLLLLLVQLRMRDTVRNEDKERRRNGLKTREGDPT
jgi:hypothetical protein